MAQGWHRVGVAKVLRNYHKEPAVFRKKILKVVLEESESETARMVRIIVALCYPPGSVIKGSGGRLIGRLFETW